MDNSEPGEFPAARDRHFVTALARGLAVLKCFKSGEERLGNQDLAERCNLPKSTVTRLTHTLTKLGFLHQSEPQGRYRLGMATLTLGGTTLSRLDIKEIGQPLMQALATDTGSMVLLGMRDDLSMLYVECCRGSSIITLRLGIGSRMPIATTSVGRAYLVGADEAERPELQTRIRAFDPVAWPRLERGIQQALDDMAEYGCIRSFGDWHREINGIAVPLAFGHGLPLMGLSAAGPALSMTPEYLMDKVRPKLIATARQFVCQVNGSCR